MPETAKVKKQATPTQLAALELGWTRKGAHARYEQPPFLDEAQRRDLDAWLAAHRGLLSNDQIRRFMLILKATDPWTFRGHDYKKESFAAKGKGLPFSHFEKLLREPRTTIMQTLDDYRNQGLTHVVFGAQIDIKQRNQLYVNDAARDQAEARRIEKISQQERARDALRVIEALHRSNGAISPSVTAFMPQELCDQFWRLGGSKWLRATLLALDADDSKRKSEGQK
jgi:hypothetical protein